MVTQDLYSFGGFPLQLYHTACTKKAYCIYIIMWLAPLPKETPNYKFSQLTRSRSGN